MTDTPSKDVICVLGMHRSGTSCLVGSLQNAGLQLGKHHTENKYNRKGNRENQDIVDINDAVLDYNGGSWENIPHTLHYSEEHLAAARAIISAFPAGIRWGFKDPRTLLTWPLWQEALQGNYLRVGIFRHPLAVAASLGYRQGSAAMSEQQALQIWQHYNKKLLAEYKRSPFPILCFDWEESLFHEKLNVVHGQLGLPPLGEHNRFYNPGLKNYDSHDLSIIPWKQRQLYKKLKGIAV
ncbi:MAG: sulfotransferase family protein [Gammaproteobacteria bacterium]|nr:sulfotransferase family protein [Gammaproteobacteria bacterium]